MSSLDNLVAEILQQAEKEANNFVSRFGDNHAKRHCKTIGQYRQNGAYSTNWTPR